jgi:hypothetical protein
MAPGKGRPAKHGYHVALTNREPAAAMRFVNLLVPLAKGEVPPVVSGVVAKPGEKNISFDLKWADGRTERVRVDLGWTSETTGKKTRWKSSGVECGDGSPPHSTRFHRTRCVSPGAAAYA